MNGVRNRHSDYWLSLAVFGLIVFGLIMIYSVSKYNSLDITNGATDKYFLKKQFIALAIGVVVWIFFQAIDYRFWQRQAGKMLFVTIGLLLLPLILSPFGISHAGRWINIAGLNFQPAEAAKLTFIFYISGLIAKQGEDTSKVQKMFWPLMGVVGVVALFMLMQKDLGTLAIFVAISASTIVVAGASIGQLITAGALTGALAWLAVKIEPYRIQRLLTFINKSDDSAAGYHIKNALIAIGSGGLWGLGFGQSKQKYLYLPEAHTDSIFAIISEELGWIRASVIIAVFIFIAIRGLKIAKGAPDAFGRLVAIGITAWLFFQMFINLGAMLSILPLTGVPLPFVSYGGSSLIILLAAVGVLNNISKSSTT